MNDQSQPTREVSRGERLWLRIAFGFAGLGVASMIVLIVFALSWRQTVTMTLDVRSGEQVEIERGHLFWRPMPESFSVKAAYPTVFSMIFNADTNPTADTEPSTALQLRTAWQEGRYVGEAGGDDVLIPVETLVYDALGNFLHREDELGIAYGEYLGREFKERPSLDEIRARRKEIIDAAKSGQPIPHPPATFEGFQSWLIARARQEPSIVATLLTALGKELPSDESTIGQLYQEYQATGRNQN